MLKIEIAGVHYQLSEEEKKYIYKKVGKLEHLLPSHAKKSAHAEVRLSRPAKARNNKRYTCEVILHLPSENITVHDGGITVEAAVDLCEDKLKSRLKKYKDKRTFGRHREIFKGAWNKVRR